MTEAKGPVVVAQMMIRKPASEVFNAFIDPAVTTNFWFTRSSGKLEEGKTVTWQWEMYGASAEVKVLEIIKDRRITIEWGSPSTTVVFEFEKLDDDKTYVTIRNFGFHQTGDELIEAIKDNTGGFTTVVDALKAYLEYGIKLNLVGDKHPRR